jgi:hypothetical protein
MQLAKMLDVRFKSGLSKLIAADIPLKSAFKLKGILQAVNDALRTYDEVRLEAVKKYGLKKEDGTLEVDENQNVKFDQEKYADFAKEMEELIATEIDVAKVSISELGEKVHISVDELNFLEPILNLK